MAAENMRLRPTGARKARLMAGISVVALVGPPAWAQTASAPAPAGRSDSQIQEIVVTATRRSEKVLDVPYNISAVTGDSIADRNITDQNELLRSIPGVSVVDRGYRNSGSLNGARIRGLNVDGAALGDYAVSSVSPLSTYVNDTPVFANFLLKDLSRVEVLRGPQGTLYGSGSLGGTVRYIQNEPDPTAFGGKISNSDYHTENSDGAGFTGDVTLNVPLAPNAAFRFTVSRIDDAGSIDYPNLYKLGPNGDPPEVAGGGPPPRSDFYGKQSVDTAHIWYEHGALLWQATDDLKFVVNYDHQDDHVGGRRQTSNGSDGFGQPYGPYDNGAVITEPSSRAVELESIESTYDLGFATLTSSTSHYDHRGQSITDNTGFYGNTNYRAPYGFLYYFHYYAPNRLPLTVFENTYSERALIEELRLVSVEGKIFDYVAGLYYEDQARGAGSQNFLPGFQATYDEDPIYGTGFVSGDRSFLYQRAERFEDKAVFGELTYHIDPDLSLTGGMRYFDNHSRVKSVIGGGVLTYNNNYASSDTVTSEKRPLGKGNLSWKLAPDTLAYATISQGYRRGGSNAIPILGPQREDASLQNFKSDSDVNYELGIKGKYAGIAYSLSAFYIDWSDVQVNIQTPTWGYYAVVNGKSAESKGAEFELDGYIVDRLHYNFGYAYTNARLTSDIITAGSIFAPQVPTVSGLNGSRLPGVADHTVNLAVDYTIPVWSDASLINRVSGYFQSSSRNAVAATGSPLDTGIDPFFLWTLSTTLAFDRYDVTLFVKNIFNARGVTGVYTNEYSGTDPAANFYGNDSRRLITAPRTIGMTFNYTF